MADQDMGDVQPLSHAAEAKAMFIRADQRMATLEEGHQDIKQAVSIDDVNKIVAAAIADHTLKIQREFGAMMSNHKKNFA